MGAYSANVREMHGSGSARNGTAPRNSGGPAPATSRPQRLLGRTSYVTDQVEEMIQSALAWRTLAQMLWTEMGKPPVPGFPASRVQQILWGELPPDNGFFAALLTALSSRPRAGGAAPSWWLQSVQRALDSHVSPDTRHITALHASHPDSDHLADMVVLSPEGNMMVFQVKDSCRGSASGTASTVDSGSGEDGTGPVSQWMKAIFEQQSDPSTLETEAEFMAALRQLKKNTKLSLRQIEERSKTTTAGWLPRSSAADLLRRETLPKPDALWSLTAALGLVKEDQDKWEAARSRLYKQRRTQRHLQSMPTKDGDPGLEEYQSLVNADLDAQTA